MQKVLRSEKTHQPLSSLSSSTLMLLVAEQHHQDGQPDGRFRRGAHGQDEEHEDLAGHVAEVVGEGHEVRC